MQRVAGLALCGLLLAGCSGPQSLQQESTFPPVFEHNVYPFEVRNASGEPLDHPFLGGFNFPRPQFADIDADGDQDLFVQEVTGHIKHFENVGSPSDARYIWRSNHYEDLDVGEWYRFVDLDNDGDLDILGEEPYSHLRFFRNEGSSETPIFGTAVDSLKDATGKPLFADRQNIPALTDIDCDGMMDLFVGRVDGTLIRYESIGMDEQNLPRFQLVTERFEDIEIVAQIGLSALHGANTLTFHDLDDDGDKDLFWGDFFEPGVLLIPNTGSCTSPNFRNEPISFPENNPLLTSGYNAPTFTDIDGDGDDDMFVGILGGAFNPNHTSAENFVFLESEGENFTVRTRQFIASVDIGSETIPAFGDLDNDGDADLLLTNKIATDDFTTGEIFHYENKGTASAPDFQIVATFDITGNFQYAPTLADMDSDGDLDMLLGTWNKGIHYYRNTGTSTSPSFTLDPEKHIRLTRGSNSTPSLVDIDADGDLDLFIGESSGEINFYHNIGDATTFSFELVSDNYLDIDVGRRSAPTFVDLDNDGDQDMVVGRENDGAALYRNMGTPQEPHFTEMPPLSLPLPFNAIVTFVDIDADGDKDLFSGSMGGGIVYYENMQSQ